MTFEIVYSMEERRKAQADQAENSSRLASEIITFRTKTVGQILVPEPLKFTNVFVEPPAILTGMVLATTPGEGWKYPQVTAGVHKWVLNEKGLYTGAYLYFNVDVAPEDGYVQIQDTPGDAARKGARLHILPYGPLRPLVAAEDLTGTIAEQRAKITERYMDVLNAKARAYVLAHQQQGADNVSRTEAKHQLQQAQRELEDIQRALARKPPKPVIDHHLMFHGKAMKTLNDDVTQQLLGLFQ